VGKFDEAVNYFAASVQNNPSYAPARFQLGLAQLAISNFADASENFHQLAVNERDVQSAAYVGYCFNKREVPVAAIPWYERAINEGADSASVYNNLGASYLDAPPILHRKEQLRRAEYNLTKALLLDPTSQAVQLNLIRCATREFDLNSDVDPWHVWRTARALLKATPEDGVVKKEVIDWYRAVNTYASHSEDRSPSSANEKMARETFAQLVRTNDIARGGSGDGNVLLRASSDKSQVSRTASHFLEPASIKIARQQADSGESK
jgi:tetratricopeptide (TPR) repeat protein